MKTMLEQICKSKIIINKREVRVTTKTVKVTKYLIYRRGGGENVCQDCSKFDSENDLMFPEEVVVSKFCFIFINNRKNVLDIIYFVHRSVNNK